MSTLDRKPLRTLREGVLHNFHDPTDQPSRILIIFTQAGFEQFSLEIGEHCVEGRPT